MIEYGVFNDEGCIYAQTDAQGAMQEWLRLIEQEGEDSEDIWVAAICPDHEEQEAGSCEECDTEEEEDDE